VSFLDVTNSVDVISGKPLSRTHDAQATPPPVRATGISREVSSNAKRQQSVMITWLYVCVGGWKMSDVAAYGGRAEEDRDVEPGTLLVAAPGLSDPNFRRTVVYVIEHGRGHPRRGPDRPSEVSVQEVLPAWAPHTSRPRRSSWRPGGRQDALCWPRSGRPRPATIAGWSAGARSGALVDSNPTRVSWRPGCAAAGVRRLLRLELRAVGRRESTGATGSSCPRC